MTVAVEIAPIDKTVPNSSRTGKYLTFRLDHEEFGIEVKKVREIVGLQHITPVPHAPRYLRGVINLRGKVIPVIDLRRKFDMADVTYGERTCIIVVWAQTAAGPVLGGLIVDSVSEVLHLDESDVEDTPDLGPRGPLNCFIGLSKAKEHVKILLDVDQVLATDPMPGRSD